MTVAMVSVLRFGSAKREAMKSRARIMRGSVRLKTRVDARRMSAFGPKRIVRGFTALPYMMRWSVDIADYDKRKMTGKV